MSQSAWKRKAKGGHGGGDEDRWLITYADMITLLMALFIMMYAMSIVSLGKFSQLAVSVRSGFGGEMTGGMTGGMPGALGISSESAALPSVLPANSFGLMTTIAGVVRKSLSREDYGNLEFLSEEGVVTIRVRADDVLFARGSADLTPSALHTLDAIAAAIRAVPHDIRVEGHTCDLPIHNARFPSNWELSAQRAISVVLCFVRNHGFSPRRLSAAGYADTVPVAPNNSEDNRARNRRIDIVLVGNGASQTSGTQSEMPAKPAAPDVAPPPVTLSPVGGAPTPVGNGSEGSRP